MDDNYFKESGLLGTWDPGRKTKLKNKPKGHQTYKEKLSQKKWYAKHRAEKLRSVRRRRALTKSKNVNNQGAFSSKPDDSGIGSKPKIFNTKGRHYKSFRFRGLGMRNKGDINRSLKLS